MVQAETIKLPLAARRVRNRLSPFDASAAAIVTDLDGDFGLSEPALKTDSADHFGSATRSRDDHDPSAR